MSLCETASPPVRLFSDADLRLLATLHTLLETRSVTRAAERLGISQPSVSRSLARARSRFGDPLLLRNGAGMVLTPRAESLREPLGAWLADGRALLSPEIVEPARLARTFRIASTDYGVLSVVRPSLQRIASAAPRVELAIQTLTTDCTRLLARGDLDLIVSGFDPDLSLTHAQLLFKEQDVCLAAPDHPDLIDGRMSREAFLAQDHIDMHVAGYALVDFGRVRNAMPRRKLVHTESFMMAPYLVAGSKAVMMAPTRAAELFSKTHGLVAFEPPITMPAYGYWLTWHERAHRDPETQWLIEELARPFVGEFVQR